MDKFNIYLFVMNFWQHVFNTSFLDISKIKIVSEEIEYIQETEPDNNSDYE